MNLETGELVADNSFENPQRYGGSDIMARIFYDTQNKDRFLQRTQAAYLKHAIESFPVDRSGELAKGLALVEQAFQVR